jgi:hypothetical protein
MKHLTFPQKIFFVAIVVSMTVVFTPIIFLRWGLPVLWDKIFWGFLSLISALIIYTVPQKIINNRLEK